MKLGKIERRILEIKTILGDEKRRKSLATGVPMSVFEGRLEQANRPLEKELDKLESERKFILDNRNSIFWRIIWNAIVPIIVSFITAYLVSKFLN
ncbi:MAG: hypothetical protein A2776_00965 [Candidatus Levybacteria bacterium RIFCSPHIGHO2_01_FULL_40_10]|nr:MAG: hypothetical protein A2776_00965 [Candidatus Levybacteria bacterium RIFCSPHIGHO2_01_FULL_40_10]